MQDYYKPGGGNKPQPYIPAGNGEESGEYTFKSSSYSDFSIREECTKEDLNQLLTDEEYYFVRRYTNYKNGRNLNDAIRNNNLSEYGKKMRDSILSAIKKHSLKQEITVYRGIKVSNATYLINFYTKYRLKERIDGLLICSATRRIKRAIKATLSPSSNEISLLFEIKLPRGYSALPIEEISFDSSEQEILISKPIYKIKDIQNWHIGKHNFKKLLIEIEEK